MIDPEVPVGKAEIFPDASEGKWEPPDYTMKQIYDAIPPHCFRPNTFLSLGYVLRDFAFVLMLGLAATQIPASLSRICVTLLGSPMLSFKDRLHWSLGAGSRMRTWRS